MEFKHKFWILLMLISILALEQVNGLKCPICFSKESDDDPCDDPQKMRCDPDFSRSDVSMIFPNLAIVSDGAEPGIGAEGVIRGDDDDDDGGGRVSGGGGRQPISFVCAKFVGRFGVIDGDMWPEEVIFRTCMPRHKNYPEGKYDIREKEVFFGEVGLGKVVFEGELTVGNAPPIAAVSGHVLGVIMALGAIAAGVLAV